MAFTPEVLDGFTYYAKKGCPVRIHGPHQHTCMSHICQGRSWICEQPRCYRPPAMGSCEICNPLPSGPPPCRCGCR
jgi:hypothetical protein